MQNIVQSIGKNMEIVEKQAEGNKQYHKLNCCMQTPKTSEELLKQKHMRTHACAGIT